MQWAGVCSSEKQRLNLQLFFNPRGQFICRIGQIIFVVLIRCSLVRQYITAKVRRLGVGTAIGHWRAMLDNCLQHAVRPNEVCTRPTVVGESRWRCMYDSLHQPSFEFLFLRSLFLLEAAFLSEVSTVCTRSASYSAAYSQHLHLPQFLTRLINLNYILECANLWQAIR